MKFISTTLLALAAIAAPASVLSVEQDVTSTGLRGLNVEDTKDSTPRKLDSTSAYFIKASDSDLYLHILGGNADMNPAVLHGDESYTKTDRCNGPCPNALFILEPEDSVPGAYYIKSYDQDLYLHILGGNQALNKAVLHGDEAYAKWVRCNGPCPNSLFIFEWEPTMPNTYYIKASDADLYLHILGGNRDFNEAVLHGDEAYTKHDRCDGPCPNSLFVLEAL